MAECSIGNIKLQIELAVLLLFFGLLLSESIKTNLVIYRTCYVVLGYNKSECALLGSKNPDNYTAQLEKLVQPHASVISMTFSLIDAFFSAIACLLVGPWSDRFGRKPIMLISVTGITLGYVLISIFAALDNLSPWYLVICSIPVILTGGGFSYITVSLCYATDVTEETNRGLKMGFFEGALSLGIFLGNISSSYVFAATNYSTVFLISALCCVLNVVFTFFVIHESLTIQESEGRLKGLFCLDNIMDMVKTAFKRRDNFRRFTVLCCILMLTLFIIQINGDGAVIFLFLREKFHWSLQQYTLYSAAHNVTWILGTIIGVYFLHKLLKIPETIMILVGFISMVNGNLVMGLANKSWEVYAAAFARSLGAVLSPMVRSLVSKVVPNEDVGKIFALIVASEAIFGLIGSPVYTAIYNSTIGTNPGIFNFVSAGLYTFEILIAIGIIIVRTLRRSNENYDHLINENVASEHSLVEEVVA